MNNNNQSETTNKNNGILVSLIIRYPYIIFSTLLLALLSIHEYNASSGSLFERAGEGYWNLLFVNLFIYICIKAFRVKKHASSSLEKQVEDALATAGLLPLDYSGKKSFTVTEDKNSIVINLNGMVQKLEKDYEKAIPVIENMMDLDVTDWNYVRGTVNIVLSKNAVEADYFYRSSVPSEYLTIGIDQTQGEVKWHYNRFPHMLLVGGTGSGKSTMFKTVISQMKYDWELFFCDPKQVEFAELAYAGYRVAFDNEAIKNSIDTVLELMENRYATMRENRVKEYRELNGEIKPAFLIIDEFAAFFSLLEQGKNKDAEVYGRKIRTIVQKGRAAGVQLILMTQKPSSKVLDTDTRDNLMCQVAMGSNKTESYVMAFGDDGRRCSPLGIGEGYYNIGNGIRKMKTYNLSTDEFIASISEENPVMS